MQMAKAKSVFLGLACFASSASALRAQTTLRSVIGRMELDKTFEERDMINASVVSALDDAALNWGVKVLRYEIKDLTPPAEILRAMQAQITAEREKRALIAASEGRRQEQINIATGEREASIARSEGIRITDDTMRELALQARHPDRFEVVDDRDPLPRRDPVLVDLEPVLAVRHQKPFEPTLW